jgi:hypothetical protein
VHRRGLSRWLADRAYELDRFFVPKEMTLHVTVMVEGLLAAALGAPQSAERLSRMTLFGSMPAVRAEATLAVGGPLR